jgi:hypothetical protein
MYERARQLMTGKYTASLTPYFLMALFCSLLARNSWTMSPRQSHQLKRWKPSCHTRLSQAKLVRLTTFSTQCFISSYLDVNHATETNYFT